MVQKMGFSLDDMFPKLMARDQDVDKEFRSIEKRLNRHRVALDKAEDRIQALEDALVTHTGNKFQFSDPVHCKHTVRKWKMYLAHTCLVHHKYIQRFPCQFPHSFPGAAGAQYTHSVPGYVAEMSQLSTLWVHLEFTQRKYHDVPKWLIHRKCSVHSQFPRSHDQGFLIR